MKLQGQGSRVKGQGFKAFERCNDTPRYFQVQTRLTDWQEAHFIRFMQKNRCSRSEAARALIAKGLEATLEVAL